MNSMALGIPTKIRKERKATSSSCTHTQFTHHIQAFASRIHIQNFRWRKNLRRFEQTWRNIIIEWKSHTLNWRGHLDNVSSCTEEHWIVTSPSHPEHTLSMSFVRFNAMCNLRLGAQTSFEKKNETFARRRHTKVFRPLWIENFMLFSLVPFIRLSFKRIANSSILHRLSNIVMHSSVDGSQTKSAKAWPRHFLFRKTFLDVFVFGIINEMKTNVKTNNFQLQWKFAHGNLNLWAFHSARGQLPWDEVTEGKWRVNLFFKLQNIELIGSRYTFNLSSVARILCGTRGTQTQTVTHSPARSVPNNLHFCEEAVVIKASI